MIVITRFPSRERELAFCIREVLSVFATAWACRLRSEPLPPLYKTQVIYQAEPQSGSGVEYWDDPWTVIKRGWGDCDDLVGWRLAELRAAGEHEAHVQVLRRGNRFHVRVRRASGTVEDPCLIMRHLQKKRAL